MKRANIIISMVLFAFGGYYAFLTARLPTRNLPNTLGVDFVPWLLVGCLFFLALLLLLTTFFGKSREHFDPRISLKEGGGILALTLAVYLYVDAMFVFGFLIVTPAFMAVLMLMTGARDWKEIVAASILAPVGIYLFFDKIFQVILPGGSFF